MQLLSADDPRHRVLVFVPRWLGGDHEGRGLPHSALAVLGALRHSGCDVLLLEEVCEGPPCPDWSAHLEAVDVAVVWCAEMYPAFQIRGILAFLDLVESHEARVPVVVGGGFFPLIDPRRLEIGGRVAALVTGPGEVVLPQLVAALAAGGSPREVPGLWHWIDGECVATPPARRRALDPAWIEPLRQLDLGRDMTHNRLTFNNDEPALQLQTGSGCAKRCPFCFDERTPYGVFPAEAVVDAIASVRGRYDVRQFLFGELDFFHKTQRVRDIARGLVERRLAVRWFALGSVVDLLRLTDEDLELVRASGCYRIEMGSESGSDRMLARLGKAHRAEDVLGVVRRLRGVGIRTTHNLVFGVPRETRADRRATLGLAARIRRLEPTAHFHPRVYQIVPMTTMGSEALAWLPGFPGTLAELAEYRHELQGGSGRALPWVSARDEEWILRLTRYVLPMAYHDPGADGGGFRRRLLRALARLRSRSDVRIGAGFEERCYERTRGNRLASTYAP